MNGGWTVNIRINGRLAAQSSLRRIEAWLNVRGRRLCNETAGHASHFGLVREWAVLAMLIEREDI